MAFKLLENHTIPPGSVLLFGSASHLFRVGASKYASDWVEASNRLNQRFRNVNICLLVPVPLDDCPESLARDIEILAIWLRDMYKNTLLGLFDSWSFVLRHIKLNTVGSTRLQYDDIFKVPLPRNISVPMPQTYIFKFNSSSPARLLKMDRKTSSELVQVLSLCLQRDFSISISLEGTLQKTTTAAEDLKDDKILVCIGSSIMQQTVPFLKALGYTVVDLSRPGWMATEENIQGLIKSMSELRLNPGFTVVLDLLSNCSHRFQQFDGTQVLAQKEGGRYHMKGPVVTCGEDTFVRIIKSLALVLLAAQDAVKVSIPPLPRYIFNPCCNVDTLY
jgi:hypothetical protein